MARQKTADPADKKDERTAQKWSANELKNFGGKKKANRFMNDARDAAILYGYDKVTQMLIKQAQTASLDKCHSIALESNLKNNGDV